MRVVVFCRAPTPGRAKTRLIPAIGRDRAAALALAMLLDVLDAALDADASVEACVADAVDIASVSALVPAGVATTVQPVGDLGARLHSVLSERLTAGHTPVVAVGSDCPQLDAAILASARDALADGADAAIAPSADGGYGLIAMAAPHAELFREIPWSTDRVLETTHVRAHDNGLRITLVGNLDDVDEPGDLSRLSHALEQGGPRPGRTWHALTRLRRV